MRKHNTHHGLVKLCQLRVWLLESSFQQQAISLPNTESCYAFGQETSTFEMSEPSVYLLVHSAASLALS